MADLEAAVREGLARARSAVAGLVGADVEAELEAIASGDALTSGGPWAASDEAGWGLCTRFRGDLEGYCLLLIDERVAGQWLEVLLEPLGLTPEVRARVQLEPPARLLEQEPFASALLELGNVMIGGFLSGVADRLHSVIEPLPPLGAHDLLGALVGTVLAGVAAETRRAIHVSARFTVGGRDWVARLILLPVTPGDAARRGEGCRAESGRTGARR